MWDRGECWRFYALIKSVLSMKNLLTKDKKVPFIAFTLIIEYSLAPGAGKFKRIFEILTTKSIEVVGLETWLGKTDKKIIQHRTADEEEDAKLMINFMK